MLRFEFPSSAAATAMQSIRIQSSVESVSAGVGMHWRTAVPTPLTSIDIINALVNKIALDDNDNS